MFVKQAGATQPDRASVLMRAACARRDGCHGPPPAEGHPPIYSDLGYILVGAAMEAATSLSLDELVRREVATPLGLVIGSARQHFQDARAIERFVPTENVAWRGGVLRGVVHDENAWVLAGQGSAGHAGLFGDVWSIVKLAVAVTDAFAGRATHWLSADDVAPLILPRPGGTHAAGFDRRGSDAPSSGAHFSADSFGHLGFTGTSVWIDPAIDLVGVVLSNRVHPTREHLAIREARPAAYDALYEAMLASS
jgi:CubicO group peptidase (beta-lactamase class C family)